MSSKHEHHKRDVKDVPREVIEENLGGLIALSKVIHELELEVKTRTRESRNVDDIGSGVTMTILEQDLQQYKARLTQSMSHLAIAFSQKNIKIHEVLAVASSLNRYECAREGMIQTVSAHAMRIAEYVKRNPKHMPAALDLLIPCLIWQEQDIEDYGKNKNKRRASELDRSIALLDDEVRAFFSATDIDDTELKRRYEFYRHVWPTLSRRNISKEKWHAYALAYYMKRILMSDHYNPDLEVRNFKDYLRENGKGDFPGLSGGMTRFDVEAGLISVASPENRREMTRKFLEVFDLPEKMIDLGKHDNERFYMEFRKRRDDEHYNELMHWLETIAQIERLRPGAVRVLYKEFNIRRFHRYPVEVLVKQYDERDKPVPFGIIFNGEVDSNGAFLMDSYKDLVKKFSNDLAHRMNFKQSPKENLSLRIVEATSQSELKEVMSRMIEKYTNHHRAKFMVLSTHGWGGYMSIGHREVEEDYISPKDIETNNGGIADIFGLLDEDGVVIFDGCFEGKKNGIAQTFSKVFKNILVFAPYGVNAALMKLWVPKGSDVPVSPIFNTISGPSVRKRGNTTGQSHVYIGGRRMSHKDLRLDSPPE